MRTGRPSGYKPEYCDTVKDYGKQGMSKAEIAVNLNITRQTLYNWMDNHDDFFDAIKEAESAAEAWYYRTFRTMAQGAFERANPTALIFAAKNQLPDIFRDRRETDVSGSIGIHEVNVDFSGYDEEQD